MKKLIILFLLSMSGVSFAQDEGTFYISGTILKNPYCQLLDAAPLLELGVITTDLKKGDWKHIKLEFYNCDIKTVTNPFGSTTGVSLDIKPDIDPTATLWANKNGSAQNVGIKLRIEDRVIPPAGTLSQPIVKNVGGDGTVSFKVEGQMVVVGEATAGSVATHISFVANYK